MRISCSVDCMVVMIIGLDTVGFPVQNMWSLVEVVGSRGK